MAHRWFPMYAHHREDGGFRHVHACRTPVAMSGGGAIHAVSVRRLVAGEAEAPHWGWLPAGEDRPRMIQPSRRQLAMCFQGEAGLRAAEERGRGAAVNLVIVPGHDPAPVPPEPSESETLAIALRLHGDQTDFGGRPYREHLEAVHANLGPDASEVERKAAYLHDTLEDCRVPDGTSGGRALTPDDLLALGFRREIVDIVLLLTREPTPRGRPEGMSRERAWELADEAYLAKIQAIVDSGNVSAMRVKLADNRHNADPARDRHLKPHQLARTARLRRRYGRSIVMLEAAIAAHGAATAPRRG